MELSIIIVNYNTKDLLRKLLTSFKNSNLGGYKVEVIIVDNGSTDGSVEQILSKGQLASGQKNEKFKMIFNKKNLGFARANNQGIRIAKGKYILLLNSDTLLTKTTLFKMLKFMDENNKYAAATCRVELVNGEIDPACHRGFPTPWASFVYFSGLEKLFSRFSRLGQYHQAWKDLHKTHEVDVISGAFFMIRKKILNKLGLLDERFFMYAEDIDLCYRMKNLGYKIVYNPNTKIIHYKTSSGRKKTKGKKFTRKDLIIRKKTSKYFFETMKFFYDKHYKDKYPWLVRKIVLLGIWLISKIKK